jgi:hypothetical protein
VHLARPDGDLGPTQAVEIWSAGDLEVVERASDIPVGQAEGGGAASRMCTTAATVGRSTSGTRPARSAHARNRRTPSPSATPSANTVRFYKGRGFELMAEPLPELFEREPEDVHMRKVL